jgi:hypothetical protein
MKTIFSSFACMFLLFGTYASVGAEDTKKQESIFSEPLDEYFDALDYYIIIDDTDLEKTKVSVLRLEKNLGKLSVVNRLEIDRLDDNILHINFKPSFGIDAWYSSRILAEIYDENLKNNNILTVSTKKPKPRIFQRSQ